MKVLDGLSWHCEIPSPEAKAAPEGEAPQGAKAELTGTVEEFVEASCIRMIRRSLFRMR